MALRAGTRRGAAGKAAVRRDWSARLEPIRAFRGGAAGPLAQIGRRAAHGAAVRRDGCASVRSPRWSSRPWYSGIWSGPPRPSRAPRGRPLIWPSRRPHQAIDRMPRRSARPRPASPRGRRSTPRSSRPSRVAATPPAPAVPERTPRAPVGFARAEGGRARGPARRGRTQGVAARDSGSRPRRSPGHRPERIPSGRG